MQIDKAKSTAFEQVSLLFDFLTYKMARLTVQFKIQWCHEYSAEPIYLPLTKYFRDFTFVQLCFTD